jgi:hypothetical protein
MARSTATGASWKTAGWPVGAPFKKTLLYLGEINASDRSAWNRAIEAVDEFTSCQASFSRNLG